MNRRGPAAARASAAVPWFTQGLTWAFGRDMIVVVFAERQRRRYSLLFHHHRRRLSRHAELGRAAAATFLGWRGRQHCARRRHASAGRFTWGWHDLRVAVPWLYLSLSRLPTASCLEKAQLGITPCCSVHVRYSGSDVTILLWTRQNGRPSKRPRRLVLGRRLEELMGASWES